MSGMSYGQVTISTNTVWDNFSTTPNTTTVDQNYVDGIFIVQGATLTIVGLNLEFNDDSDGVQISNGHLVIESCTLRFEGLTSGINIIDNQFVAYPRSLNFKNSTLTSKVLNWKGINVIDWHGGASQYTQEPEEGSDCNPENWFGEVRTSDFYSHVDIVNCTIEHAEVAVKIHKGAFPANFEGAGAITRLRDNTIVNCLTGFWYDGFNGELPLYEKYAGYIMTCNFLWDENFSFSNYSYNFTPNHKHLYFNENAGWMNIGGCNFENNRPTQSCPNERGTGIYSYKSIIGLSKDGDNCCEDESGCYDNCYQDGSTNRGNTFKNLGTGVLIDGVGTYNGNLPYLFARNSIRQSEFLNCATAIELRDLEEVSIGDNTFTIEKSTFDAVFYTPSNDPTGACVFPGGSSFPTQIKTTECTGLSVYRNTFTTNFETGHFIDLQNNNQPGFGSQIKSNILSNTSVSPSVVLGICAGGRHKHLDIRCNNFSNLFNDIKAIGNSGEVLDDIPNNSQKDAKNTYSIGGQNILTSNSQIKVFIDGTNPNSPSGVTPLGAVGGYVDCTISCEDLKNKPLSVEDLKEDNRLFMVYPNPTNKIITIELVENKGFSFSEYEVYTTEGSRITSGSLMGHKATVNLQKYPSGVYFVRVYGRRASSVHRLIKL